MLLALTRGTPFCSLLFTLLYPPLRSLYPNYYGVEGVLLYPYLEGG